MLVQVSLSLKSKRIVEVINKYLWNQQVTECKKIDSHQEISTSQLSVFFFQAVLLHRSLWFLFLTTPPTTPHSVAVGREDITSAKNASTTNMILAAVFLSPYLTDSHNSATWVLYFYPGGLLIICPQSHGEELAEAGFEISPHCESQRFFSSFLDHFHPHKVFSFLYLSSFLY